MFADSYDNAHAARAPCTCNDMVVRLNTTLTLMAGVESQIREVRTSTSLKQTPWLLRYVLPQHPSNALFQRRE